MTSQDRIEANRINAKRSTGPRTTSGKARSSLNARKHGLTGKSIVIGDEDPKEFEAFRESLQHDWQPNTAYESELVDRAAGLFWRLRRVPAIEVAIVEFRREELYSEMYAVVAKEKLRRISEEADRRCRESFAYDSLGIQTAIGSGLWDQKFDEIWKQVWDEQHSKQDIYTWMSKEADTWYKNRRESELVLLIRSAENGDPIDRLSRYEASLMNVLQKTLQQLWLVRNMNDKSQTIAPETAVGRARLTLDKLDPKG